MDPGARRVGLTLAMGGLLVVVDTTVTMVAVPAIVAGLGSTLPTVQWATTGYLLGVVSIIPVAGWAANRYGDRRVYIAALATFTVFSALAGLAWDTGSLIGFRVLQGLGGGLLNPVGQAIGLRVVPRGARGRMMSLIGLPVVIGPVLGLPLAGALVDVASWRWIFAVNVPIGLAAIVSCLRVLPRAERAPTVREPVDWPGLGQLSGGGVLLVLGCTLLGEAGTLTPAMVAALVAGAGLLAAFATRALRVSHPVVELRLLRHRPLAAATVVLVCFGAAYFGCMTILPLYVQAARGDPATLAGTLTIPAGLATGLTLQVATRLVDRVEPGRIVVAGTAIGLLGCLALLVTTTHQVPYPAIAAASAVLGVGSGATLMPTMTLAVRDLEGADTARGTTLLALLQQLASGVGVAVVATALTLLVTARVPALDGGGIAAMLALSAGRRAVLGPDLAAGVGSTYLVGLALLTLSLLAAAIGLRRAAGGRKPARPDHQVANPRSDPSS